MKKILVQVFILLIAVLALLTACGQQPLATQPPQAAGIATPPPTPQPTLTPQPAKPAVATPAIELLPEKITSQALTGNLLGDPTERTAYVLLPPGYATSAKRYPVVYVIPWGTGEPSDNAWGFKGAMESLLGNGEVEEMIVVVPNGTNKLGASQFRSSPTIGDYETYVTQEVVSYMDTYYRTLPTRDSRGLAGCSNGGSAAMRLGFKYPNVFSVVAPTDGGYDDSLEVWPSDVEEVQRLKELPRDIPDLRRRELTEWYVQAAAGTAPDPNNPPFYCEMPFRIVDGKGEFVSEVIAKIVEHDAAHEARRYVEQPVRLRGILIRHGLDDTDFEKSVHSFEQLLTDLGIEHEYVEVEHGHCGDGWEAASLKYMSDKLVFTATPLTRNNLNSVWGSSDHDIFAVGELGTILHYDGNAWSPMNSGTHSFLTTVWGSSESDVFVDGWDGTILHYDGSTWSLMDSGTSNRLWGVWGNSGDNVFAFGEWRPDPAL